MSRVRGHGLRHEGRPVLAEGCCAAVGSHGQRNYYDNLGHGICECGAVSPCEDTIAARQRWHRQHKITVAAAVSDSVRSAERHGCDG